MRLTLDAALIPWLAASAALPIVHSFRLSRTLALCIPPFEK